LKKVAEEEKNWIPACAGMTHTLVMPLKNGIQNYFPAPGGRELKGGGINKDVSPSF
jgi:hypothetical protein